MEGSFGWDFGGSSGVKLDSGIIMEQVGEGTDSYGQRAGASAENDGQMLPEVHQEAGGLPG